VIFKKYNGKFCPHSVVNVFRMTLATNSGSSPKQY